MKLFEMPPFANFYPKIETREAMQYCRKTDLPAGGFQKPGVFPSPDMTTDLAWFFAAILAELVSLFALFLSTGLAIEYIFSAVGVAFILDVFMAYWHHRLRCGRVSINMARIAMASIGGGEYRGRDSAFGQKEILRLEDENRRLILWSYLPVAVLLALTCLKIFTYIGLHGFTFDVGTLFIIACYLLVVFIHVRNTGYVLFTLPASRHWNRDVRRFNPEESPQRDSGGATINYTQEIGSNLEKLSVSRKGKAVHWVEVDLLSSLKAIRSAKLEADRIELDELVNGLEFGHEMEGERGNDSRTVLESRARRLLQRYPNFRVLKLVGTSILMDLEVDQLVNKLVDVDSQRELALAGLTVQLKQLSS